MQINPSSKTVTYLLDKLEAVEQGLNSIEKEALENGSVTCDVARSICSDLNLIRDSLGFKRGVLRHKKWAPELLNN